MHVELVGICIGLLQVGSCVEFGHTSWYRPVSQTQADAGGMDVMYAGQLSHCVLPLAEAIWPLGHSLHLATPLPLNFPGGHGAQSGRVVVAFASVAVAFPCSPALQSVSLQIACPSSS